MKKVAFTIVLNGMPFILKQIDIIMSVFDEWHIIEGATLPLRDTEWCKIIDEKFFNTQEGEYYGCSNDGTSEILDKLVNKFPGRVFVYRKGDLWSGKTEMCQCIQPIMKDCILMQIDIDEIWKPEILKDIFNYCENNSGFDGMIFKCNFYVGPNLVIYDEDTHPNKKDVWTRLWVLKEQTEWESHEPPKIKGLSNMLGKDFTGECGWIFDHYAYFFTKQLEFKENFYGYDGATVAWKIMQKCEDKKFRLYRFFTWIDNDDIVSRV